VFRKRLLSALQIKYIKVECSRSRVGSLSKNAHPHTGKSYTYINGWQNRVAE
jgi:hypothetical protein